MISSRLDCMVSLSPPANQRRREFSGLSGASDPDSVTEVKPRIIIGAKPEAEHLPVIAPNADRTIQIEQRAIGAFESAIKGKNPAQLLRLAACNPSLIEQYPTCLLLTDEEGKTLVHRMGESGYTLLIRKALNTEQGRFALHAKDHNGDTGLHCAAQAQTPGCLDAVIASGPGQLLLEQNKEGLLPLHIAIIRGHISSSINMMDSAADTLVTMDNSNKTPLHCLEFSRASQQAQLVFLKRAIEKPCVRERLNHLLFFLNLHSTDAQCEKRIQQLRRSVLPAFRPVTPGLNKKTAILQTGSETFEQPPRSRVLSTPAIDRQKIPSCSALIKAMDLSSTVSSANQVLRQRAVQTLQWLGEVGVYGTFFCMKMETERNYASLGDENASVQLVNQLVALGAAKIQLRLSPPWHKFTDTQQSETAERSGDDDPEYVQGLKRATKVGLNKLALLIPGFCPDKSLPQCLRMEKSTVSIVQCDDSAPEPAVVFSFLDLPDKHQQHPVSCEHFMVVKPFRFDSSVSDGRVLYTDFDGLNVRKIPLHLPPNSLLPEVDVIKAFSSDHDERQWFSKTLSDSPVNSSLQANSLGRICSLCRQGHIHMGVMYGATHQDTPSLRAALLSRWVDALQIITKRGKPTLIMISKSLENSKLLDSPCMAKKLTIIDSESEEVGALLDQFSQNGAVAICLLPTLPKPVFQYLLTVSDLPVLTEGANTTSFLLQSGHPYLSLLPNGETPIPRDAGYPLEALKIEALSYKLRMNEEEQDLLEKAHSLIFHRHYQEAKDYLDDHKEALADLRFINDPQHQVLSAVSVRSLLEKGVQKRLGKIEAMALLSAINPSVDTLVEYIDDCFNHSSIVVNHFALQRMHVGHDYNNALIATIDKFAHIKGLWKGR